MNKFIETAKFKLISTTEKATKLGDGRYVPLRAQKKDQGRNT